METSFSAFAPASLSNLGPGFDSLGIGLSTWKDEVRVVLIQEPNFSVSFDPTGCWSGPIDPFRNTASVSAMHVATKAGYEGGARMTIQKGVRAGSGLGSSAASADAGALAMNAALGSPFSKTELIASCLAGESVVSGAVHGDNVLPSLMGGIVLVEPDSPTTFQHIQTSCLLHFAILLPNIEVFTEEARSLLPDHVSLHSAAIWASRLAQLVLAISNGDLSRIGQLVMEDDIVEPVRARLIKPYRDIKLAALKEGALGCALSGSGPAMFAVCDSEDSALRISKSMHLACMRHHIESLAISDHVNFVGAFSN